MTYFLYVEGTCNSSIPNSTNPLVAIEVYRGFFKEHKLTGVTASPVHKLVDVGASLQGAPEKLTYLKGQ